MTTTSPPQFPDEQSDDGEFNRQEDEFRDFIRDENGARFAPEPGRYHLYISAACPWAHRTQIARCLLRLEDAVSLSAVDPIRDERGWAFREGRGHGPDPVNGFSFLSEAYQRTRAGFRGRVTVPVLWDRREGVIVNNSEDDICLMFQRELAPAVHGGAAPIDWFPSDIESDQADLSGLIYERVNNGVYRAGFASRQAAYERAVAALFETLDQLDQRLRDRRFLFGQQPVETDWRLFCTLIRFDAVYHGHFKCNLRRIADYPNLSAYTRDLYQWPGIAETVDFDHIKRHYYVTHDDINPTGIVPLGPIQDFTRPHGRQYLC